MLLRSGSVPVLYHGTTRARAAHILRDGFRISKHGHYLGHGVCLSECITVAYEHGAFEDERVVLRVQLSEATVWGDKVTGDIEKCLQTGPAAAARLYCGNVWVVWPTRVIAAIRPLRRVEAHSLLHEAFSERGQDVGYNGVVQDLADAYWSARAA